MPAFTHIAFYCHDLAAQEAFYTKHFGMKRCRTMKTGQPDEFFLLKLGNMRLELFPTDPTKVAGKKGGEQPIGYRHLAFEVDKLEPVLASIAQDGIQPDLIKDVGHLIPGLRIAFFKDPEGNIIELMEGYKDEE